MADKTEFSTIAKIADRALSIVPTLKKIDILMDIEAVHSGECPLRLDALLSADEFNFTHDVFGIRRHLNRETGKLENHFSPRFAKREPVAKAAE